MRAPTQGHFILVGSAESSADRVGALWGDGACFYVFYGLYVEKVCPGRMPGTDRPSEDDEPKGGISRDPECCVRRVEAPEARKGAFAICQG